MTSIKRFGALRRRDQSTRAKLTSDCTLPDFLDKPSLALTSPASHNGRNSIQDRQATTEIGTDNDPIPARMGQQAATC